MNVKRIALTASILGILSLMVSCTNASQHGKSAMKTKDGNQNAKLQSVGVTLGDLGNPFFVVIGKGAEAEAKKIGGDDVKVTVVSSAYDLNQQTNQVENFI